MDLTSDHPYWFLKNGLLHTYPFPAHDETCDVAVVGAGITGAMVAHKLSTAGYSVVVLDGRDVCRGSTSASTALLQYEIDVSLKNLASLIGEDNAVMAYRLSHQSIDDLENLVRDTEADCGFRRKQSIQLAYTRKEAKGLADEHRARKSIGLDCQYHNAEETFELFGVRGVAALSNCQAASCDGYRLAHELLSRAAKNGARIYDRTQVTDFDCQDRQVTLKTSRDAKIVARHVVIATGYEAQTMLKEKVVDLHNTYACVSEPLSSVTPWNPDWMLWEVATPYLYVRSTDDNRLLVGGEDDRYHNATKRDLSIAYKSEVIHTKARQLIPDLEWEVEFAWGGTFGTTKDGLAYIGESSEYPGCYFTLGFGGNGITFSVIAANLITDMMRGCKTAQMQLFRFGRSL